MTQKTNCVAIALNYMVSVFDGNASYYCEQGSLFVAGTECHFHIVTSCYGSFQTTLIHCFHYYSFFGFQSLHAHWNFVDLSPMRESENALREVRMQKENEAWSYSLW